MCDDWFCLCCCLILLLVKILFNIVCWFGTSPHLLCASLGTKSLDPPLTWFFKHDFQTMLVIFCFFVWMLMFIFTFILVKHFLMLQVQSLFVIKLDNNLTLGNMFFNYTIDIYIYIYCITLPSSFFIFNFSMKIGGLNELF
jgi:hypothetical protein